jgi:hypothetical protein
VYVIYVRFKKINILMGKGVVTLLFCLRPAKY